MMPQSLTLVSGTMESSGMSIVAFMALSNILIVSIQGASMNSVVVIFANGFPIIPDVIM